ncbi:hypothetical protein OIO90_001084 [Microbotryomycetes sp. JL221]|nr:hypothetical protein OIO90_001084 [Microbotryomycetes sp. JL221]
MGRDESAPFTVYRALQRSRQTILNELLPVYSHAFDDESGSDRDRFKPLCSTTVKLGPHIFMDTELVCTQDINSTAVTSIAGHSSSKSATKRKKSDAAKAASNASAAPAITPALIKRLNVASASNSDLAKTLRKAANGTASQQELANLAKIIDRIQKEDDDKAASQARGRAALDTATPTASASTSTASTSAKASNSAETNSDPPQLLIRFKESPLSTFLIPGHFQHSVHASARPDAAEDVDVVLSFFVTPESSRGKQKLDPVDDGGVAIPVDIVIEECNEATQAVIAACSRTNRRKDPRVEEWWKQAVGSEEDEQPFPLFDTQQGVFKPGVPGGLAGAKRVEELRALEAAKIPVAKKRRRR